MRGNYFVLLFLTFFPREKGYDNLGLDGVRDSCSAGKSINYIFNLEAYISFGRGCAVLSAKNHYLLLFILQIYFYYFFVISHIVHVCVYCSCAGKCLVVDIPVSDCE